jgi:hypothetical protein
LTSLKTQRRLSWGHPLGEGGRDSLSKRTLLERDSLSLKEGDSLFLKGLLRERQPLSKRERQPLSKRERQPLSKRERQPLSKRPS